MVGICWEILYWIGVTSEIDEISNEMAVCSGDAVRASERIKHYNTLKVHIARSSFM